MGKRVVITDHARVRYAERVLGLNLDQMIIKDMRENEVNEKRKGAWVWIVSD